MITQKDKMLKVLRLNDNLSIENQKRDDEEIIKISLQGKMENNQNVSKVF